MGAVTSPSIPLQLQQVCSAGAGADMGLINHLVTTALHSSCNQEAVATNLLTEHS